MTRLTQVLVRCSDVARTFGRGTESVVAVHGATCEVAMGDRVALTGASGSGKSTLLHLMAGLERPTAGEVTWPGLGDDPVAAPGLIGIVFQGPSLLPVLDVAENVSLPLVLAGMSDAEARARAMSSLSRLGIDDLAPKLPEELSGGQAQRVAVARVLAGRPSLILADEPTGQLDSTTGAHVIDVLLTAADLIGAAVVVSTHDADVAARLGGVEWQMHDGALRGYVSTPAGFGGTA